MKHKISKFNKMLKFFPLLKTQKSHHYLTFFISLSFIVPKTYLYQMDQRALPGNILVQNFFCYLPLPTINKMSRTKPLISSLFSSLHTSGNNVLPSYSCQFTDICVLLQSFPSVSEIISKWRTHFSLYTSLYRQSAHKFHHFFNPYPTNVENRVSS